MPSYTKLDPADITDEGANVMPPFLEALLPLITFHNAAEGTDRMTARCELCLTDMLVPTSRCLISKAVDVIQGHAASSGHIQLLRVRSAPCTQLQQPGKGDNQCICERL